MNPFGLVHMQPDLLRKMSRGRAQRSCGGTRGERLWSTLACVAVLLGAVAGALVGVLHH